VELAQAGPNRRWRNLSTSFPESIRYDVSLDTTLAITAGIDEIIETLFHRPGVGDPGGFHFHSGLAGGIDSHHRHTGFPGRCLSSSFR
jgi:hypothetical protein